MGKKVSPEIKKKKSYKTQNSKIWTINFSALKFLQKAKVLIPVLKNRVALNSIGLTVLVAIEYCMQERVIKDFSAYVDSRRSLLEKR